MIDPVTGQAIGLGISFLAQLIGDENDPEVVQQAKDLYDTLPHNIRANVDRASEGEAKSRDFAKNNLRLTEYEKVGAYNPNDPFSSRQASALGQRPVGYYEDLHDWEKAGLQSQAEDDDSEEALARFKNPFFEAVTQKAFNKINEGADFRQQQLSRNSSRLGRGSGRENAIALNERDRNSSLGDAAAYYGLLGHDYAKNARNQFNQKKIGSGTFVRNFIDRGLSLSNPNAQHAQNQYLQSELAHLPLTQQHSALAGTAPGDQYGQATPGDLQRAGGFGQAIFAPNAQGQSVFGNLYNQYGQQGAPQAQPVSSIQRPIQQGLQPNYSQFRQNPNLNYNPQFGS